MGWSPQLLSFFFFVRERERKRVEEPMASALRLCA